MIDSGASPALAIAVAFCFAVVALDASAQEQTWIRQTGTGAADAAQALCPDGAGGVFVGGSTQGSLGGGNAGNWDAWLARYDDSGNQTWIRQLGTSAIDHVSSLATDGAGGVFIAGSTQGSLGGGNAGNYDPWLAHYDGSGNQTWIRQFGIEGRDEVSALAPDGAGGVYIGGTTGGALGGGWAGSIDSWLARYDASGNRTWIRQIGTSGVDAAYGLASNGAAGVYFAGWTSGSLGGANAGVRDAWLARYDASGNQSWIRQFGTSTNDDTSALTPDGAGGAFIGGHTQGSLGGGSAGDWDAWLARYDASGNQSWIRQFGTATTDFAYALCPDGAGGVFYCGKTFGDFSGGNAGSYDTWLAAYDSSGNQTWITQFGTTTYEEARALASDDAGGAFIAGFTAGSLGGPNAGGDDAWLALYAGGGIGTPARVANFTVQTGAHISGNTADLRESDNERLKVDAEFIEGGNPPYLMILEVKLKSQVIDPTDLHVLVEGKLSQNGGTAKLYLRNWAQGGWTRIATDPIGKTEMIQKVGGLDPAKYINASGVMKLRIRHQKTTSSNGDPFRSLIDHVQALVR